MFTYTGWLCLCRGIIYKQILGPSHPIGLSYLLVVAQELYPAKDGSGSASGEPGQRARTSQNSFHFLSVHDILAPVWAALSAAVPGRRDIGQRGGQEAGDGGRPHHHHLSAPPRHQGSH